MLSSALALLLSGIFLSLRLGTNSGSFPRPLSAAEERAAQIIRLRYGLSDGKRSGETPRMTQREAAAATGISRSYVLR